MFTVNVQGPYPGNEKVYEATMIEFVSIEDTESKAAPGLHIHVKDYGGYHGCLHVPYSDKGKPHRTVFVMNGEGKTVARYAL